MHVYFVRLNSSLIPYETSAEWWRGGLRLRSSVTSVETHSENADTHITHPSHSYLTVSLLFFFYIYTFLLNQDYCSDESSTWCLCFTLGVWYFYERVILDGAALPGTINAIKIIILNIYMKTIYLPLLPPLSPPLPPLLRKIPFSAASSTLQAVASYRFMWIFGEKKKKEKLAVKMCVKS